MHTQKFLRALLYLGPLLLWMGIVLVGSTRLGAYENSLAFIQGTAELLNPEETPSNDVWQLYQINNAARKLAHIVAFGVFTMLAVRAMQWGASRLKWQSLVGSLGLSLLFAFSEAFVRFRSPERHVRLEQFVLNGIGALAVFGLTLLYFRLKSWEALLWEGKSAESDESGTHRTQSL